MSMYDPFYTFDAAPYQTTGRLPLQTLIKLIQLLSTRLPSDAPTHVKDAELEMRTAAKEAAKAMVIRLRETNVVALALDLALDIGMDGLFILMRDRLRGWERYQRVGLDFLLVDPEFQLQFEATREQAERAGKLLTKLFGDGNLQMLSRQWPEQSQLMTNVLDLIDQDQLEPELLELTGDELLPTIRRVNVEYAAMVDRRATDASNSEADLRLERIKVQRYILGYASMVLRMMKPGKPETIELVETALEPMITLRPPTTTGASAEAPAPGQTPGQIGDPDADLAAVLAEAQAELEQAP